MGPAVAGLIGAGIGAVAGIAGTLITTFYMSETVYIETSILEITKDWWELRRNAFTLYTSEAVLDEVIRGDSEVAAQRLEILRGFPLLALNQAVQGLAAQFLARSNLPPKAGVDAIHIAAATVHGMDYLLTWNCRHIANAQIQGKLAEISLDCGYVLPILCTPNELMGD